MASFRKIMNWIGISTGCVSAGIVTTTSIYTGKEYGTTDTMGELTTSTQEASVTLGNGNSLQGTIAFGTVGGTMTTIGNTMESSDNSREPDTIVFFKDENGYQKIEAKAQNIYDSFNKNHNSTYELPVILADTPEKAASLKKILCAFETKEELYIYLTALQTALENKEEHYVTREKKLKK